MGIVNLLQVEQFVWDKVMAHDHALTVIYSP